jgi:hypothetical protein
MMPIMVSPVRHLRRPPGRRQDASKDAQTTTAAWNYGMGSSAEPGGSRYASFREFYPFYLGEHANRTSRRLHVSGTLLAVALAAAALLTGRLALLLAVPVAGYAFAWVGHYFFEKNTPATFTHPLYSLRGDFTMLYEVLTGRLRW